MPVSLWQAFHVPQITWHPALQEGLLHSWRISHILIWKTSGELLHVFAKVLAMEPPPPHGQDSRESWGMVKKNHYHGKGGADYGSSQRAVPV